MRGAVRSACLGFSSSLSTLDRNHLMNFSGDSDIEGRMICCGVDEWVHLKCIYFMNNLIDSDGELVNICEVVDVAKQSVFVFQSNLVRF